MITKTSAEPQLWYRVNARNLAVFAIAYLLPVGLVVLFLRRIHVRTVIICFLIAPSVFFGLAMLVRPKWVERMRRVWNRELERTGEGLERRPPTGFP